MRFYWLIYGLALTLGCAGNRKGYHRLSGGMIDVELIEPIDDSEAYKVRVITAKNLTVKPVEAKQMLYATDSLFYLSNEEAKHYPAQVEFVATGIAGVYEYIVYFNGDSNAQSFVFDDRHLTHEAYKIELKED